MSKTGTRKDKEMKSIVDLPSGTIARVVTPSYVQKAYNIASLFATSPSFPPNDFDKITEVAYSDRYELVYSFGGVDQFVITYPYDETSGSIDTAVVSVEILLLEDGVDAFLLEGGTDRIRLEGS